MILSPLFWPAASLSFLIDSAPYVYIGVFLHIFFCQVHMGFTIEVTGVLSLNFSLVLFFLNWDV